MAANDTAAAEPIIRITARTGPRQGSWRKAGRRSTRWRLSSKSAKAFTG